jgi:hypothetical protein
MRFFSGSMISAGLVLSAVAANAQVLPPHPIGGPHYAVVSDFDGVPYGAMPQDAPVPRYGYGYGPSLLPPEEVYTVLRENGFSPLGIPRQRGMVYTIAAVDRRGTDGRLVIDARTGRILRFMPADRMGYFNPGEDSAGAYGAVGPLPPVSAVRGPPRPPGNIPHVASRTPPKAAAPYAADVKPGTAPAPAQQSAAVQAKPADAPAAVVTTGAVPPKPAPQILPTQTMPQMQGLD